jgi:hypothetical protein
MQSDILTNPQLVHTLDLFGAAIGGYFVLLRYA